MGYDRLETGNRIRNVRAKKNWTQQELAERAEMSIQHLRGLENGQRNLTAESLSNLSGALGVSTDYLLMGKSSTSDFVYQMLSGVLKELADIG